MGKKVLKFIRNIFFVILIICVVFLLSVFIFDRYNNSQEKQYLTDNGYVNPVSVGDYNLNTHIYGNENGKHTIVGISGMGSTDYAVGIQNITESLSKDNKIVVIDRAGYGLSDDTFEEQTIDRIVNDYRNALKNSGCEAPYVLMAHSLGGVYSSYWESTYPDEIEAVIYLDTTVISDLSAFEKDPEVWSVSADDFINAVGTKAGLFRLLDVFEPLKPWASATEENLEASKAFWYNSPYSFAMYSEAKLSLDNITKAHNSIKKNDIPKLFIDATTYTKEDMVEMIEYIDSLYTKMGLESELNPNDDKKMDEIWALRADQAKTIKSDAIDPYMEMLGNCTYTHIPGYHEIYSHKPKEVIKATTEFLEKL